MVRYQNTATAGGVAVVLVARLLLLQREFATPLQASFGRSLLGFNPYLHQPPPPSYPLYVAMGKFVNFFLHDALTSLLAISVIASVATFVLLSRSVHPLVGLVAAFIPFRTEPLPDAAAIACFAAAVYFWRERRMVPMGIAAAAVVGVVPQTVFVMVLLVAVSGPASAGLPFAATLLVEFLQVSQNIELRRMRAFIGANIDLGRTFDPLAAKVVAAAVLAALTYHFVSAKAHDLARDPDVQRRGEH